VEGGARPDPGWVCGGDGPQREGRDDAEGAVACSAERAEEVGVLGWGDGAECAVGEEEVVGEDVVASPAVAIGPV
jgi:hypothetical protein